MERLHKIDGIDRFLLVGGSLFIGDLPPLFLFLFSPIPIVGILPFIAAWVWSILASLIFGFITTQQGGQLFGTKMFLRLGAFLFVEILPGAGVLPLLSVGIFVTTYLHNKEVSRQEEEREM